MQRRPCMQRRQPSRTAGHRSTVRLGWPSIPPTGYDTARLLPCAARAPLRCAASRSVRNRPSSPIKSRLRIALSPKHRPNKVLISNPDLTTFGNIEASSKT
eukprot:6183936-Pleurochrysis_carterae.AAC.5